MHILRCMGSTFCAKFQRANLKLHIKFWTTYTAKYDPPRKLRSADKQLLSQPLCRLKTYARWPSMMTSSNGNIFRVTVHLCGEFTGPGEFPTQRPVTRSFDVFFDLSLNKRLSKQSRGWWFQTQSRPLWRHCNAEAGDCSHPPPMAHRDMVTTHSSKQLQLYRTISLPVYRLRKLLIVSK